MFLGVYIQLLHVNHHVSIVSVRRDVICIMSVVQTCWFDGVYSIFQNWPKKTDRVK